eukprot:5148977-Amphidinium_carterae.1
MANDKNAVDVMQGPAGQSLRREHSLFMHDNEARSDCMMHLLATLGVPPWLSGQTARKDVRFLSPWYVWGWGVGVAMLVPELTSNQIGPKGGDGRRRVRERGPRLTAVTAAPLAIGTDETTRVAHIRKFLAPYRTEKSQDAIITTFILGCSAIQPHSPSLENTSATENSTIRIKNNTKHLLVILIVSTFLSEIHPANHSSHAHASKTGWARPGMPSLTSAAGDW